MEIDIPSGKYIVAVSGGVDSMTLLDVLAKKPTLELIVAHFNHGIRPDAKADEKLVSQTVQKLGLPFEVGYGRLGVGASEARARTARYRFLEQIRRKYKANAIITAHHQDDLVETALINLLRGTNWRGLASIRNRSHLIRPFLNYSRSQINRYASNHHLKWREDISNSDIGYLRNYFRHKVIPKLGRQQRKSLISKIDNIAIKWSEFDEELATLSRLLLYEDKLKRQTFNSLPLKVAKEVLAYILRIEKVKDVDQVTVNRLTMAIRNAAAGTYHPVRGDIQMKLTKNQAIFVRGR